MSKDDLKKELDQSVQQLKTIRDEIKVKIHLAGMDAKDSWTKLSKEMEKVFSNVSREVSEQSRTLVKDVVERANKLRDSLKTEPKS